MILYQLKCSGGHEFEAWFRDGATYEQQAAGGDVVCPFCSDNRVAKVPTAPHLARHHGADRDAGQQAEAPAAEGATEDRARHVAEQILQAVERLRRHVEDDFEDVGDAFAEEARRIHYGEAEDRGIYGEASEDDVLELDEEGIEVYRLPGSARKND